MTPYETRATTASSVLPIRLANAIVRQHARNPRCPDTPRLDGKLAVVTGGNAGIGVEIARGLAKRGAEVVIAARTRETSKRACERIAAETGATMREVVLDLSDLDSVRAAVDALGSRPADVVVANAGLWPRAYATSKQGHEIAFATNTLGHYLFVTTMPLAKNARVVVVTGDIYIRQSECTSDFTYEGSSGGALAYCRSKLGNLWFASELQRRRPELEVCSVHPGVINSNLGEGQSVKGIGALFRRKVLLDCEEGAQTPLWCATQPIERGAYYHNTLGRLTHPPSDPAGDAKRAAALWDRLASLST